jgi:hypothetical protein
VSRLAWKRLPNGDRMCTTHPIRLRKPASRSNEDVGWMVFVPMWPDHVMGDGWAWRGVLVPDPAEPGREVPLEAPNYNVAREVVVEHLDAILAQIDPGYDQDWIAGGEADAARQEQRVAEWEAASARLEQEQREMRAEYDRSLAAHEQTLVDGLLRLSDQRRQRVLDEVRKGERR